MKRIIKHLRKQPESLKIQILHILIITSAIILLILWINSFGPDANDTDKVSDTKEVLAPFSILNNVIEGIKNLETPW